MARKNRKSNNRLNAQVKAPATQVDAVEPQGTTGSDEQELILVNQSILKKALHQLKVGDADSPISKKLELYYAKHDEYNKQYFDGLLSYPLITIEKMNNRTLAYYTAGKDPMNIENHITFNINFVALNDDKRVLETLRHEMIHQWQDEVLYMKEGVQAKEVKVPLTEKGEKPDTFTFLNEWSTIPQKRRPQEWHNRDFKDYATVVGILADGPHCTGNPAKMPEPKSYNRKFACACIASNGYRMTVWSTRAVNATCNVCKQPFEELHKSGSTIQVKQSHVELPGEDAVEKEMKQRFDYFVKFKTRGDRVVFLDDLQHRGLEDLEVEEGHYQNKHNAYKDGYRYWVAYNGTNPIPEPPDTITDDEDMEEAPLVKNRRGRRTKKAPAPQPVTTATQATDDEKSVALAKREYENPADLIALYRELGSLKHVAGYFGVSPASITYQKKKYTIDFKEGTYVENGEKKHV